MSLRFGFLFRDPLVGARIEQVKGQRAAVKHFVVELADVEFRAEFFLRALAKLAELELTQLVAQGLGRP